MVNVSGPTLIPCNFSSLSAWHLVVFFFVQQLPSLLIFTYSCRSISPIWNLNILKLVPWSPHAYKSSCATSHVSWLNTTEVIPEISVIFNHQTLMVPETLLTFSQLTDCLCRSDQLWLSCKLQVTHLISSMGIIYKHSFKCVTHTQHFDRSNITHYLTWYLRLDNIANTNIMHNLISQ
jgi:hypothetical protein